MSSLPFRFIPSIDGNWGGLVDPVKNTFNGMIGMLQRYVRVNVTVGTAGATYHGIPTH